MNTSYVATEIFTNGYKPEFLDILTLFAILCGILVIVSKNPIVSVLFLIGLFLSVSSYLMTLGLNFIGLSYLLVYVGAVSILFLFILMLINVKVSELLSNTNNSIPLAVILSVSFYYPVSKILPYSTAKFGNADISIDSFNDYINIQFNTLEENSVLYLVTSKIWDGNLSESSHITSIGNIMYSSYSIWLLITSIILLLAMIGAIVITIKQKN